MSITNNLGAWGALTISRFRPLRRALLPWGAAAVMLFGGELVAQAQPFITPGPPQCTDSGTTVTCKGDLSGGVDVVNGEGTYTKLIVRDLTNDIVLANESRKGGIGFDSSGDIDITVDTGDFRITILDNCSDCAGVAANSFEDGNVMITIQGNIKTEGVSNEGISVGSTGDNDDRDGAVTVKIEGDITTTGELSSGIYATSESGDVTTTIQGDITTTGERSVGIYAGSDHGDVTITIQGNIKTEDLRSNGIGAKSDGGAIDITLNGETTITSATSTGVEFNGGTNNTLTIGKGAVVMISGGLSDVHAHGSKNETIDNYGTLTTTGLIDLGEGDNSFNNKAGATFNSGTFVKLRHEGDNSVTDDIFANWGNLTPGGASAVQTTELWGDFTNQKSSTFTVTTGPDDSSDQLIVSRSAALLGGTVRVVGTYEGTYTILRTPNSLLRSEDRFDDVIDTLFINHELIYNTNTVQLIAERRYDSFCEVAGANQRAGACNSLDGLPETTKVAQAVLTIPVNGTAQAQAAFDALSGEVHASLKGALMDTSQRRVAAVNHLTDTRFGNLDARASTAAFGNLSSLADGDNGFWITGYGSRSETDVTSSGTARMETNLSGVLLGVDRALGDHWRLGVLGGYSRTDVNQRARLSSASVDTWSAGLYGGAEAGPWGLGFGVIYNGHAADTRRTVSFTGFSPERLSAGYHARSWQLFAEAGHKVQVGSLMLKPFAGVSHTGFASNGFSESGGAAALTSSSDTDNATFTTLGLRSAMALLDTIHVRGMAGWRHAFGDTEPSSTATLRNSTTAFTVTGAPIAEDALVTEIGIEAGLLDNVFLGVAYKGRYSDGVTVHGFNASLRATF